MSSLDALVEVLETLMPEEVERQFKEEASSEAAPTETQANAERRFFDCFESCCKPTRESRLDLLIDALRQQMPPTVKLLIEQEQDRLYEELMECREELPDSSNSSVVSSVEDLPEIEDEDGVVDEDELDSDGPGWSNHEEVFAGIETSNNSANDIAADEDVHEQLNDEENRLEDMEDLRETSGEILFDDGDVVEAVFDGHDGIPRTIESPMREGSPASTFSSATEILEECRKRRGSGARPFRCHVCNCGFGHKSTLRNHFRIHTGERPHRCCVCLKTFSQIGNLKRHLAQHANLALSCPRCGVIFAFGHLLQVHLRSCRKQGQAQPKQAAKISAARNSTNSCKPMVLQSPMKEQTATPVPEVEPIPVEVPGKQGPTREDHSVAEVTTAWPSEKPGKQVKLWTMYPCPHCDKVLTWQYDLRQHMESHRRLRYLKGSKRPEGLSLSGALYREKASSPVGGLEASSIVGGR